MRLLLLILFPFLLYAQDSITYTHNEKITKDNWPSACELEIDGKLVECKVVDAGGFPSFKYDTSFAVGARSFRFRFINFWGPGPWSKTFTFTKQVVLPPDTTPGINLESSKRSSGIAVIGK